MRRKPQNLADPRDLLRHGKYAPDGRKLDDESEFVGVRTPDTDPDHPAPRKPPTKKPRRIAR